MQKKQFTLSICFLKKRKRERGSLGGGEESHLWFYQVFLSQISGENKRKRGKKRFSTFGYRNGASRTQEKIIVGQMKEKFLPVFFIMGLTIQTVTALQKGVSEGKYIRRRG